MRLNNFRVSGSILTGLFAVDVPRGRDDNVGTIFTVPAPKNLWGQKIVQTFSPFLATFDFHREYLRNGSTYRTSGKLDQPQLLPRWTKEIWWTLVHKQKSSRGAYWATQINILRETTFRPLGGIAPSNFYTR